MMGSQETVLYIDRIIFNWQRSYSLLKSGMLLWSATILSDGQPSDRLSNTRRRQDMV